MRSSSDSSLYFLCQKQGLTLIPPSLLLLLFVQQQDSDSLKTLIDYEAFRKKINKKLILRIARRAGFT